MGIKSRLLLPFLLLATLVAPLASAATTARDNGLLISRTNSQTWQVRLISGSQPQQFSGVVDSSVGFASATSVRLESADAATLTLPNQLSLTLATWNGGSDAANFTVSVDADLCLRDTGSSGVKIYLGTTLADAIPVTAPVALQGANACGDATPSATAFASTRKSNTGHYVAMLRNQSSQALMTASIKPGVVGIMKRYTWRSLEPTQGAYNFAEIQSDLAWAKSYGMQLIVMIEDKTFVLERPNPAYLDAYTPRNRAGGYTVLRWNPYVVGRLNALIKALGSKVDSHSNFEGIATQETSLGFDGTVLKANGYTPEKYRDAYINILSAAMTSMPTSRVFWYQNFFVGNQSYIGQVAAAVAPKGVVMGGPDVLPDNPALVSKSYPYYTQFQGKMPLFSQVEPVCYSALHMTSGYSTKYWTPAEQFKYARDKLHVNYMIWVRLPKATPADSYDWLDAVPVMGANPTFN